MRAENHKRETEQIPKRVVVGEFPRLSEVMAVERAVQVGDALIVYVAGAFEMSALLRSFDVIFEITEEVKPRTTIVHGLGMTGELNVVDRYEFGVYGARKMSMADHRFALILCVPEALLDPDRFGQKVASTRGLETRITTEFQEALEMAEIPLCASDLL